jgi:hypothetical protein
VTIPKRFIDERSDADDFERAILRSELEAPPPAAAENEVLSRVLAAVGPIPGGPGPSPAAGGALGGGALAKGAATLGGLGKGFVLGIGVSAAVATGNHYLGGQPSRDGAEPASTPSVHAVSVSSATSGRKLLAAPVETPTSDTPSESSQRVDAPTNERRAGGAVGDAPPPSSRAEEPERAPGAPSVASFPSTDGAALAASRLKEEAALLRRARAELRSGALTAAFATLEASRREFTAPELFQEREALSIELLHRSGERAAAAARAREFLSHFPESPHAATVRAFADESRR